MGIIVSLSKSPDCSCIRREDVKAESSNYKVVRVDCSPVTTGTLEGRGEDTERAVGSHVRTLARQICRTDIYKPRIEASDETNAADPEITDF